MPLPKPGATAAKKPVAKKAPVAAKKAPARKTAASARPAYPTFAAPADFKPAFVEVQFEIGEDGLMIPTSFQASRVRGRWDNAEAKRYNMMEYDVPTALGIATRFAYVSFAPNLLKRLPSGGKYFIVLRVAKRSADGTLTAGVKAARYVNAAGKWKWFVDKADPNYRKLRKATRSLPSAFVDFQLPPAARRSKKSEEESED